MPRAASILRVLLDEYALSATRASGRVRGGPGPSRGTRMSPRTSSSIARRCADRRSARSPTASRCRRPRHGPCYPDRRASGRPLWPSGSSAFRFLWFAAAPCGLVRSGGVGPELMCPVDRRVHLGRPIDVPGGVGLGQQRSMNPVPDPEPGVEAVLLREAHPLWKARLLGVAGPCLPTVVAGAQAWSIYRYCSMLDLAFRRVHLEFT